MDKMANALNELSRAQTTTTPRATFEALDFNITEDVETFIQQFQEVANGNEWSNTVSLLHIHMHLQDDARECGNHPTLEEVLKARRCKYRLSTRKAGTWLINIKRDVKFSLEDHATEVKKLVGLAHADLPRYHQEEMTLN